MKALWIIPAPVNGMQDVVNSNSFSSSGTWISAAIDSCVSEQLFELSIAVLSCSKRTTIEKQGIVYYGLDLPLLRGHTSNSSEILWMNLIYESQPDVIQISGTEYSFGLDIIHAARKLSVPIIVSIHGVMKAISKYPSGCLPSHEYLKDGGILTYLKSAHYQRYHGAVIKQLTIEAQLIENSDAIIVDSLWEEGFCNAATDSMNHFYHIPLPLEKYYFDTTWSPSRLNATTVFCVAGRTPYKGLHDAIEAIALLEKCYGIKATLQIPGDVSYRGKWLRRPPYIEYIINKIKRYGLQGRVVFLGRLSSPEMCFHMSQASMFVMPSSIENQSATLRQAMLMGVPVISSMVGSAHEVVIHGENGLMYRYGEYEVLAREIFELFNSPELAIQLAETGKQSMRSLYSGSTANKLLQSYSDLLSRTSSDGR